MKIAYIYSNLPSYRRDFFTRLNSRLSDENVTLMVMHGTLTDKKIVKQDSGSEYQTYPFQSFKHKMGIITLVTIDGLFGKFKEIKPDAVVISYMSTNVTMLKIARYCMIHHIPYATWRCGYNRDYNSLAARIRGALINYVEKHANYNITYGTWYRNELLKKGIPEDHIVIAQNTINTDDILKDNADLIRDYKHSVTKVLYVGSLIPAKHLPSSIYAIKKLVNKGINVTLDIVGGGEVIDELKTQVKTLKLEEIVRIHGPKYGEDVKKFFRESDLFLAAGTGGLAINEAMAYGLPLVTTNADGTICDLIDGNGFFMDRFGDADLQAEFIEKFALLSPEEKVKMAARSREIIGTKATLTNMVAKHQFVCEKLLKTNNLKY